MSASVEDKDAVIAALRAENAALRQRQAARDTAFDERAAHQRAANEVLAAIAASPGDPQPVFDLIVQQVTTVLDTPTAMLFQYDGQLVHFRADAGTADLLGRDVLDDLLRSYPMAPHRGTVGFRAILDAKVVHVRDFAADLDRPAELQALPYRSQISVPLLRDGRPIGVLSSGSPRLDAFSDAQIALLQTFAEQAVIAITSAETYRALQTRTADLQESLEYQTATSDVLKVISRSTFDLQPVLDAVAETAVRLCDADQAMISRCENGMGWLGANFGFPTEYEAAVRSTGPIPIPPDSPSVSWRAIRGGRVVHIEDVTTVPGYSRVAIDLGKQRTSLGVPLLRDGQAIGCIVLARQRVEPFSERQIALVTTFADQAVIAIENTRLINEQTEALERQTATAEVLQVINTSPGNLQPVFQAMLEKAMALCGASFGMLRTFDGEYWKAVATINVPEVVQAHWRTPAKTSPGGAHERLVRGERVVHSTVTRSDEGYLSGSPSAVALVDVAGARTYLAVALRQDERLLGSITIYRQEVRPFTGRQIALLEDFAAQAVIAIENVRLLTEQQEALERQTAMAEVLQVINANPRNLTPVFDTILAKAHTLCRAELGSLGVFDGRLFRKVARYGYEGSADEFLSKPYPPLPVHAPFFKGETVHIADVLDPALLDPRAGTGVDYARSSRLRTWLEVPLWKDGTLLGTISGWRREPRPFSDKEIRLLQHFADQAVIAMENARLLTEQREALERQTAMAEVLVAINASPGDLGPVFDAILEKAVRLCRSAFGTLSTFDGHRSHLAAGYGLTTEMMDLLRPPRTPVKGAPTGRILDGEPFVHVMDTTDQDVYRAGDGPTVAFIDQIGARTALFVGLRHDSTLLGYLILFRREVLPFSDKEIALVMNFAAQAVIAMENARLLTEQREALERQTAMAEVLEIINLNPGEVQPVFDAILERAHRICKVNVGAFGLYDGTLFRVQSAVGYPPATEAILRAGFAPSSVHEPLFRGERAYTPDRERRAWTPENESVLFFLREAGLNTIVLVPLFKDGTLLGFISAARREVAPFSDREIGLLENFAAQAVIAMENARLLTETREALERQTATAEVLQVINESPGDLTPVFDAILNKAHTLCGAAIGSLYTWDGESVRAVATHGFPENYAAFARQNHPPNFMIHPLIEGERYHHVPDVRALEPTSDKHASSIMEQTDARTILIIPLRKDGAFAGFITAVRTEVRPFVEKEIALLENFAAQAVIAMENARLLTEQKEALERQTATAELLQVINASSGDLTPVFEAILDKAHALCGATVGSLQTCDGETVRAAATHGFPDEYAVALRQGAPLSDGVRQITDDGTRSGQVPDLRLFQGPFSRLGRFLLEETGVRTLLLVPLRKDGAFLGYISAMRPEVRPFSEKEVALVENFASQAVVAMENARLLTEQREALEQQTAVAEVLRAINTNPGDLAPVFETILDKAHAVCGATIGSVLEYDGSTVRALATRGFPDDFAELVTKGYAPLPVQRRLIDGDRMWHVADVTETPPSETAQTREGRTLLDIGVRTGLLLPLRGETAVVGFISAWRNEVRPFSDREIALLENFAAQAVIAMDNARLLREQREALERQTATTEVLQAINANPGNLSPVFDAMLEKAALLCDAQCGSFFKIDGDTVQAVATRGLSAEYHAELTKKGAIGPLSGVARVAGGEDVVHLPDMRLGGSYLAGEPFTVRTVDVFGLRTWLGVPLRKDGVALGLLAVARFEVRPFTDRQIDLLKSFAAQAVIAMDNARLLTELRESLEQQTAMAELLRIINQSPGNPQPVFDAMLEKAMLLCGVAFGFLGTWDGQVRQVVAARGLPPAMTDYAATHLATTPNPSILRVFETRRSVHVLDLTEDEGYRNGHPDSLAIVHLGGVRTALHVPLVKDDAAIGCFTFYRREVQAFSGQEIALLENFAAQAVVAMDNARLLNEIRQRQSELDITFENMGDGVAMFDAEQKLAAWNRNFQDILDLPDDAVRVGLPFADYIRGLAAKGEYGADVNADEQITRLTALLVQANRFERTRPNGRVIDIRQNPIPGGGFVIIYADITERKRAEEALRAARDDAESALRDLKLAQANLVQAEKMASLGQLTAGIAHEIKNPLNFVNNFASLSVELLDELKETAAPAFATLDGDARADVEDLSETLTGNLKKIEEHGKRADGIVRSMLEHSRGSSGERRAVDINALVDEALNLAYHGARAQDQSFNITLERDFAPGIAPIEVNPQDLTRVFLNLFSNGFYAANRRARDGASAGFSPELTVTTRDLGERVEIQVRDNGTGIPENIRDKLFQPFFTTKPTGEGTGLGLSITYDIVTKQHGGTIVVDSEVGDHTTFSIGLPRHMFANQGDRS